MTKPKCSKCEDSGEVMQGRPENCDNPEMIPCPACQPVPKQEEGFVKELERTCGQCALYLPMSAGCPHWNRTAFSKGCKLFEYTNPMLRIDGLQAEVKWLEGEVKIKDRIIENLASGIEKRAGIPTLPKGDKDV